MTAERKHRGNLVDVDVHVLVAQHASDVADLQGHVATQIALDREVEFIGMRRLEVGIEHQRVAGLGGGTPIAIGQTREERLTECLANALGIKAGRVRVDTDAEGGGRIRTAWSEARPRNGSSRALDGLNQANAKERNEN